jgi:hypothetical protein
MKMSDLKHSKKSNALFLLLLLVMATGIYYLFNYKLLIRMMSPHGMHYFISIVIFSALSAFILKTRCSIASTVIIFVSHYLFLVIIHIIANNYTNPCQNCDYSSSELISVYFLNPYYAILLAPNAIFIAFVFILVRRTKNT